MTGLALMYSCFDADLYVYERKTPAWRREKTVTKGEQQLTQAAVSQRYAGQTRMSKSSGTCT